MLGLKPCGLCGGCRGRLIGAGVWCLTRQLLELAPVSRQFPELAPVSDVFVGGCGHQFGIHSDFVGFTFRDVSVGIVVLRFCCLFGVCFRVSVLLGLFACVLSVWVFVLGVCLCVCLRFCGGVRGTVAGVAGS